MNVPFFLALLSLAVWLYLLLGRGFFWRVVLPPRAPAPERWPSVVAVVPARNEAPVVGDAVSSLLSQDYPGRFSLVLVDDHSDDGTADVARRAAQTVGKSDQLQVLAARALPAGWTGKLWALSEGVRQVEEGAGAPDLWLFTDADIAHHRSNLSELVARLEAEKRDLVSLMVMLHCQSWAERFLIPAFVFFFAMLYPFAWSNDPRRQTAAAAGGCVLMRQSAYRRVGGFEGLRTALIDDCTLARMVKRNGGSIWLGLTRETKSLRGYPVLGDIWRMVARTAYAQLGYSALLLAGTVIGLVVTYLAPPILIFAGGATAWVAAAAFALMTIAYAPMVRFYGLPLFWALALPGIAAVYLCATIDSARRYWQGAGGEWKGRVEWRNQA